MGGGDNELIIKSILDNTGFEKGSKKLMSAINGLSSSFKSMFARIAGAASVFGVISKAVSTFLSQNQQLTKEMNAAWTALGNALGPLITQVVNWITMAVSYLVTLMKLLGFTAKTASQASKAAQGAGGALQRTVAGFDELNKLSSGGGGGAGTLKDFDPDIFTEKLAELLRNHLWEEAGRLIADKINGLIEGIDFGAIATKLSDFIKGVFEFFVGLIDELDFKMVGEKIRDFFTNIDWEGIAKDVGGLLGAVWDAAVEFLWGLMGGGDEKPPIIQAFDNLKQSIIDLWDAASPKLKDLWENKIKPILDTVVNEKLPEFIEALADAIEDLAKVINGDMSFGEFLDQMSGLEAILLSITGASVITNLAKLVKLISGLGTSFAGSGLGGALGLGAGKAAAGAVTEATTAATVAAEGAGAAAGAGAGAAFLTGLGVAGIVAELGLAAYAIVDTVDQTAKVGFAEAGLSVEEYTKNLEEMEAQVEREQQNFDMLSDCGADLTSAYDNLTMARLGVIHAEEQLADAMGISVEELRTMREAEKEAVSSTDALTGTLDDNAQKMTDSAEETETFAERIKTSVSEAFTTMKDTASEKMTTMKDSLSTKVSEIKEKASTDFANMKNQVTSQIQSMKDSVVNKFSDIKSRVFGTLSEMAGSAWNWGKDLIQNLWNGISSQLSSFFGGIRDIAQGIRDFLGFSEPKKGPLSDFHTYGPDMMELYATGIQSESAKVFSAVNDVAEGVANGLNGSPLSMSAVANGSVVPYGVSSASPSAANDSTALAIDELRGLIVDFRNAVENMQWVAQFGDLRAVAQRVTTIQKQMERANG